MNHDDLERLVRDGDTAAVEELLKSLSTTDAAHAIARLSAQDRAFVIDGLDPDDAANLVEQIPESQATELLERLAPDAAAAIIEELPSDERADLLGDMDDEDAGAILAHLSPDTARDARLLSAYPDEVAGGLMVTEFLSFPASRTVDDVRDDLAANAEQYRDYSVQYIYVVDPRGRLVGVLRLRDLLFARRTQEIGDLMLRRPHHVRDTATLDELRDFFASQHFYGAPVVDRAGLLLGLVLRADVEQAQATRTETDFLKTQGIVGGEELRSMPVLRRTGRRLAWLSINVGLNILAASIIAFYQDTLAAVIALAVFLPIISDMSGCSGNQAVAVSMRELSLGLVHPREVLRVWLKEISVGVLNGIALGILVGLAAFLWKGSMLLGAVVGSAMVLNTMIAVSIGGVLPLILRRMRMDPALASGPVLTTVTDMCGFFLLLSFAAALLV